MKVPGTDPGLDGAGRAEADLIAVAGLQTKEATR